MSAEPHLPVLDPTASPPPRIRERVRPAAAWPTGNPSGWGRSNTALSDAPDPALPSAAPAPAAPALTPPDQVAVPAVQPASTAPVAAVVSPAVAVPEHEHVVATLVPAEPIHVEPAKPLSELVQRRDSQEFRDLFRDLVALNVSDVHMTRSVLDDSFTVEARLDGEMQPVHTYKGVQAQTIATLIKTESKMSSGVNLVPEDGNYELPIDNYPYRARAVALPLFDGGERITFRLPQIGPVRHLDDLGFTETNLRATKSLLDIPGGMTLFAGPTGEGKSTTSLGALKYLREREDGVFISLEDPVERVVPGVAQIEVKEEIFGAGFGDFMKYLVRADPNVLFIGEIRDSATATAAVAIAKSGIRLIATIHASNNVSAFLRLMEMADTSPLSVLESVNGIISQRLVRRLVPGARQQFSGRYPIHEVTKNSEALMDALVANSSRAEISAAALMTSTTFKQNVDELVDAGLTTREEARKVVSNV